MKRALFPRLVLLLAVFVPAIAQAHPMPFSYLDLRLQPGGIDVTLVAHTFDVAHDLGVADPVRLMDPAVSGARREELFQLVGGRLHVGAQRVRWTGVAVLPERQSLQIIGHVAATAGAISIDAQLFPYDSAHQTFINVYEADTLTLQAILDSRKTGLVYFPGSRQGILAVMRRFVPDGMRHVASGREHWLFLAGLLLLGVTTGQLLRLVLAFAAADVLTTTAIVLDIAHPAARLTDPALALAIVYTGADNLLVRGGRDVRPWIAMAFGVLHGFWFGGGLAVMDLPRAALGWSLVAFDAGALAAQAAIMAGLAVVIGIVQQRGPMAQRALLLTGSAIVIAGGAMLFVQRVFFPAGLFQAPGVGR